jgi:O-methyltransferase
MALSRRIAGLAQTTLRRAGLDVRKIAPPVPGIPDAELYHPRFEPWESSSWDARFAAALERSLVSRDRLYVLYTLLSQACDAVAGDVIECGVYRGGTARMLGEVLSRAQSAKRLYLCDSFSGMPDVDANVDLHKRGDFADTSLEQVRAFLSPVPNAVFVPGLIPESFEEIPEGRFSFAHIDVDIYEAVHAATAYVYPRMNAGGFIIYDDYGFASCPGARKAVDEFYAGRVERPLVLASGQCVVFKAQSDAA